ncbi:MAG: DinB family protein [Streptosporangiaceae bacterium]
MVADLEDPRRLEPPFVLGERQMLEGWLEFHRMTLLLKCEGLSDASRKQRPVATSVLSLHGLVRHMAEVERGWFRRVLLCDDGAPRVWDSSAAPDGAFTSVDDADWGADLAAWQAECAASREAAAPRELDDSGLRHGNPCTLRWIYVHMIEEYARHNGHADLIRELVDGSVGW